MTISDGSKPICVYDLTPSVEQEESQTERRFHGIASACGALWAYGYRVLLLSLDGIQWRDFAGGLDIPGSFSVSAIVGDENGAFVFARSRSGLRCYSVAKNTWRFTKLPLLPSSSSDALAVRIDGAVVACLNEGNGCTQFMRFQDSQGVWEHLPPALLGIAAHFELSDSGAGICALWGIEREDGVALPAPSAVYRTQDFGVSWSKIQQMDTMLLCGASYKGHPTLLGGSDGYIAEGNVEGFTDCYLRSADEVAAISSERSQQAFLLASLEEPPRQVLLWRSTSSEWQRFDLGVPERISGIQFFHFGVILLCTQLSLFRYRLELVQ
jgi:hypothetical protein